MSTAIAPHSSPRRSKLGIVTLLVVVAGIVATICAGVALCTYVSGPGDAQDCGWTVLYIVAPQKAAGGEGADQANADRNAACAGAFASPVRSAEIAFWVAVGIDAAAIILLVAQSRAKRTEARKFWELHKDA